MTDATPSARRAARRSRPTTPTVWRPTGRPGAPAFLQTVMRQIINYKRPLIAIDDCSSLGDKPGLIVSFPRGGRIENQRTCLLRVEMASPSEWPMPMNCACVRLVQLLGPDCNWRAPALTWTTTSVLAFAAYSRTRSSLSTGRLLGPGATMSFVTSTKPLVDHVRWRSWNSGRVRGVPVLAGVAPAGTAHE